MLDFAGAALTFTIASPIAWEHHYGNLPPILIAILIFSLMLHQTRPKTAQLFLLALSYFLAASYLPFVKSAAATPLIHLSNPTCYFLAGLFCR